MNNYTQKEFSIMSFAWAGFGATFGPVMLFALFWRRSNRNGALAGLIIVVSLLTAPPSQEILAEFDNV